MLSDTAQWAHTKRVMEWIIAYLCFSFLLVMIFGYLQTAIRAQDYHPEDHSSKSMVYSALVIALIILQAAVSTALLRGTVWFTPAAIFLSFTLLCHHTVIHRHSRFEGETCSCAPFQCKDVSNHETWVVASNVAAAVSFFHV